MIIMHSAVKPHDSQSDWHYLDCTVCHYHGVGKSGEHLIHDHETYHSGWQLARVGDGARIITWPPLDAA